MWDPTLDLPLRLCPEDLTAPPDPQLETQQTFDGGGLTGSHMKFSQIERGINNISAASRGDKKFNRVFHPVSTTPLVS